MTYAGYDARGHATGKVDGPNSLTLQHDRAERLHTIKEATGQKRLLKTFKFYNNALAGQWRKSKLREAR